MMKWNSQDCKQTELKTRILNISLLCFHALVFLLNSCNLPLKYEACFFFFFTCVPYSATLHCDPRWNLGCIQKPYGHGTCGCHGNRNTQRLQRSLCFIKWLQGMTKRTWASGMKDVRSGFDLFTEPSVEAIFFNGDKLRRTRLLCIPSQESVLFTDTAGAFITAECCNIR